MRDRSIGRWGLALALGVVGGNALAAQDATPPTEAIREDDPVALATEHLRTYLASLDAADRARIAPLAQRYLDSWGVVAGQDAGPDATDAYRAAFRALYDASPEASRAALERHLAAAVRSLRGVREQEGARPTTWRVEPTEDAWRITPSRGGAPQTSFAPLLDLLGADHWGNRSKNRPGLKRAGDRIILAPGDYPRFRVTATYDVPGYRITGKAPPPARIELGSDDVTTIQGDEPGKVRILPNTEIGGTTTLVLEWAGALTFQNLVFVADDRSAISSIQPSSNAWKSRGHPGYRDLRFLGCDILGGRNFEKATGPKVLWGVLCYEMGRSASDDFGFVFAGTKARPSRIRGIHKEHAFYMHNTCAASPDANALLLEHLDVRWCGRTFLQVTARVSEGPNGRGTIVVRHCNVEDVCMAGGGGGSAIHFAGNHDGRVELTDVTVRLGANPKLHPDYQGNVTGCFVSHHGKGSEDRDTREIVIRDCHFQVGPHFTGKHSARRSNVNVGAVGRFELRGTAIHSSVGARPALEFDPSTLTEVILGDDCDVRGDILWGAERFNDRDEDGDGWPDGHAYDQFLRELEGEDANGDGKVLEVAPVSVTVVRTTDGDGTSDGTR